MTRGPSFLASIPQGVLLVNSTHWKMGLAQLMPLHGDYDNAGCSLPNHVLYLARHSREISYLTLLSH